MNPKTFFPTIVMTLVLTMGLFGCETSPTSESPANPSETPGGASVTQTETPGEPSQTPTILTLATATMDPNATSATPALATQTSGPAAPKTDHYVFVGQNMPDKIKVTPGAVLTITWAIKNTGTIGWTKDYTIRYFSGITAGHDYYPFPQTVPANGVVNLSVTITAPKTLGTYTTWWKLTNPSGQNFGDVDFTFEVSTQK